MTDTKADVNPFGKLNYLEVWNHERFNTLMERDPFTDADFQSVFDSWNSYRTQVQDWFAIAERGMLNYESVV